MDGTSKIRSRLAEIPWPEFGFAAEPPATAASEFAHRLATTRAAMGRAGLSHLVVYGDREHFANLAWLCGLDPRFEEALLIIGGSGRPLAVTGVECAAYLPVSSLWNAGGLRHEVFEPFSLMGISRANSRTLEQIFRAEGIGAGAVVGCVGWKAYANVTACDAPSYVVDALRAIAGFNAVRNAVELFIDPDTGLRTFASARELAWFEYVNVLASEGMKRMIRAIREGVTDRELSAQLGWDGLPQGCHWGVKTGPRRVSLASPRGAAVERGNPLSANVCYWGANSCRAGWVAESAADLPAQARDYLDAFVAPYFDAMVEWFRLLRIGVRGGEIDGAVRARFAVTLNPGHLIHLDEWMHTPIYEGSEVPLHSGMVLQSDVIPAASPYSSTRVEDGYALADAALQAEFAAEFPEAFRRCEARREFMRSALGLQVADEVLPLSNLCGIVNPYLLNPALAMTAVSCV